MLMPGTPMLFQGQEFAASSPFLYFADHDPQLARSVRRGRRDFLRQFPSLASEEMTDHLARPDAADSFRRSALNPDERRANASAWALHRDLLALRRDDRVLGRLPERVDGAVLGARAWLLRFFADDGDRLLIVNLGPDLTLRPAPEPLTAPLEGQAWQILWSSEAPDYGGSGTPALYRSGHLRLPAESALVLAPGPAAAAKPRGRRK